MKLNSFDIIEHYKGCQYIVLTTALHTETNEEMVIYKKCEDSQSQVFARPLKMFDDEIDGRKRFIKIKSYVNESTTKNN
jgi:hypothetical protein